MLGLPRAFVVALPSSLAGNLPKRRGVPGCQASVMQHPSCVAFVQAPDPYLEAPTRTPAYTPRCARKQQGGAQSLHSPLPHTLTINLFVQPASPYPHTLPRMPLCLSPQQPSADTYSILRATPPPQPTYHTPRSAPPHIYHHTHTLVCVPTVGAPTTPSFLFSASPPHTRRTHPCLPPQPHHSTSLCKGPQWPPRALGGGTPQRRGDAPPAARARVA